MNVVNLFKKFSILFILVINTYISFYGIDMYLFIYLFCSRWNVESSLFNLFNAGLSNAIHKNQLRCHESFSSSTKRIGKKKPTATFHIRGTCGHLVHVIIFKLTKTSSVMSLEYSLKSDSIGINYIILQVFKNILRS